MADVAIVFVGTWSHESQDRPSLSLDRFDDSVVDYTASANPNTVLVVTTPGAVLLPYAAVVRAALGWWTEVVCPAALPGLSWQRACTSGDREI